MTDPDGTVLVVDDEREVADAYTLRLRGAYETLTVYSGEAALDTLADEDEDVDVVLLDRRMPGLSGDEVLREVRDRGVDVQVVMLTAIDPGMDVVDMPFDDYLCKPVEREDLLAAVDQQLRSTAYARLSEYFELESKRAVLEAQLADPSSADDRYADLLDRRDTLREELAARIDDFESVVADFEAVDREPP